MRTQQAATERKPARPAAEAVPPPPQGPEPGHGTPGGPGQAASTSRTRQLAGLLTWIARSWLVPAGRESYHEQKQ